MLRTPRRLAPEHQTHEHDCPPHLHLHVNRHLGHMNETELILAPDVRQPQPSPPPLMGTHSAPVTPARTRARIHSFSLASPLKPSKGPVASSFQLYPKLITGRHLPWTCPGPSHPFLLDLCCDPPSRSQLPTPQSILNTEPKRSCENLSLITLLLLRTFQRLPRHSGKKPEASRWPQFLLLLLL